MFATLLARLQEPSTYAGLGVLFAMFGFNVDPGLLQHGVMVASGAAGIAAAVMADKK